MVRHVQPASSFPVDDGGRAARGAPDCIHDLVADIRASAPRIESDGELAEELVGRLAAAGIFRLAVPRSLGGPEADPLTICSVVEDLSQFDGSTGWCAMIATVTGAVTGRVDQTVAARMLAGPRFLIAGVAAPMGRAVPVEGGYRVTGRWPLASASLPASWLVGGCTIVDGGASMLDANGLPVVRHVVVPVAEATIHRTWHVAGLQGTASHDMAIDDVFVSERAVLLPGRTGPLPGSRLHPSGARPAVDGRRGSGTRRRTRGRG
jgi:alkylation response protein AidB-like acyl-CoA dehydrogenase